MAQVLTWKCVSLPMFPPRTVNGVVTPPIPEGVDPDGNGKRTIPGISVPSTHLVVPLGVPSTPGTVEIVGMIVAVSGERVLVMKPKVAVEGVSVLTDGVTDVVRLGIASTSVRTLTALPLPSAK